MSSRPILSITFMTPGKKKTLEMCLESIRWMQQDFPCELVIVDTGCDADHRALIEKYADKIVDFRWIDDFAAARNAGIAECSGEWFMIMDDDEVIKDYRPLKQFFESGEYRKYQWIMTLEHDFVDWDESDYVKYYWTRATRNEPGYRYEGKIHEYLVGPTDAAVAVPAVFGHYGYIFDNDKQRMEHAKRNITLLEEGLKEKPDNVHFAIQLAQEYHAIGERTKKESVCEKFYPIAKESFDRNDQAWKDSLYCGWVDAMYASGNNERTMELVCQGLNQESIGEEAKTFLYCIAVHTCFQERQYQDCILYAKKYLENYKAYVSAVEVSGALFFIKTVYEPLQYQYVVQSILLSAVHMRDAILLKEYAHMLDWSEERLELHDAIGDVFEQSLNDPDMLSFAASLLDAIITSERLCKLLIPKMESMNCDFTPLYCRLANIISVVPFLKRASYRRLIELEANLDELEVWPEWKKAMLRIQWALADILSEDEMSLENQTRAIQEFVDAGAVYYPAKYTSEAMEKEVCLSCEAILWKRMSEMLGQVGAGNATDAIQIIKTAMGMRADYDRAIARWIHAYGAMARDNNSAATDEMQLLAMQIKKQAKELIESGNREAAKEVLLQLQKMMPNDIEIQEMMAEI